MALRNIAIIAHVDHGKTTLIDTLLQQSGSFRDNQHVEERALDSNDLERERGITILAKVTSVVWKDTRINIVDTPGHADFGGEVERILDMVDGAIVLVDAAEGPMPQTKFVLSKALKAGLKPILALNKIDKPDQRADDVLDEMFDLFVALDADEEQLDFKVLYGSAKQGWMGNSPDDTQNGMKPLLDQVIAHVPEPHTEQGPFRMLATTIELDPFLGRVLTGRIFSGSIKPNDQVHGLSADNNILERGRISRILQFKGLERQPVAEAHAGDIVAVAGLSTATVADTIAAPAIVSALQAQPVDPPTLSMLFKVNDGPLAGKEGDRVQSRVIRDRLYTEAEGNVALEVADGPDGDSYEVAGRGELLLSVLIETMRREGFELCVGRPKVVLREQDNQLFEPIEEIIVDVDEEYSGPVVQKLNERKGNMTGMKPSGGGRTRLVFHVPTRGLIGYQSELLSDTRGTATFNRVFFEYAPYRGKMPGRRTGVLISNGNGKASPFALFNLEDRGRMLIEPGVEVYEGMIVGEHARGNDLDVNVLKGKQLSNVRAAGKDDAIKLTPPVRLSLEQALSYIADDECVEVTPKNIRLRKILLDPHERKRASRQAAKTG